MSKEATNPKSDDKAAYYEAYMERVGNEKLPAYEPVVGEPELANLKDLIDRNWLSEGKYVREFEERLAVECERDYSLVFSHATAGLITGMVSSGIGAGDHVIVPSLTHSADPNSISLTGASPVFAEVDRNLTLNLDTIKKARTDKTKAILYVSLYGNVGALDDIAAYAKEENLIFINDCAPALFGRYKGKAIASYGDFSILSFFADKTITTGEGGMLLTDNEDLINECNIYKHDGRRERGYDLIERRGYNFRITEMQAAIGVAQLDRAPGFIEKKIENYALYKELLDPIDAVSVFQFNPDAQPVPHRNIIFVPNARELIDHLEAAGIGARTLFMPMHSQPCYKTGQEFPVTEELYSTGVCLPSAPTLTRRDIEFIVATVRVFYQ